jgi:hypothetical protein
MLARKSVIAAVALVFAGIGAHSLNPPELYREMYPIEPVKQDAFKICNDTDPTFIRAVGAEREACYNSMPHVMAVAMGQVVPGGALKIEALTDPSREAELLMTLAAMPPRQPITIPRSFSNTAWVRALSPPCDNKGPTPTASYNTPAGLPPLPGAGRAASLDNAIRNNLPPLPRTAPQVTAARTDRVPVITRGPASPPIMSGDGSDKAAAVNPLPAPAPDVGDASPLGIVPLPTNSCGGA